MCAAAVIGANSKSKRQILITAVVDEEHDSIGMRALLARGVRAEEAIITEPTRLAICPAHRGFAWFDVELRGRAAHGSRYDVGIDAITYAGLLLTELDRLERTRHAGPTHPLLGRGSLHASKIQGGVGMSIYPERFDLAIETDDSRRVGRKSDAGDHGRLRSREVGASRVRRPRYIEYCTASERCAGRCASGEKARRRDRARRNSRQH